jgi:signal transduction histidine kinase
MICVHGQDFREVTRALLSVSRRCDEAGVRLCFVGSEAGLERARQVARDQDAQGLQGLCFRPLGVERWAPGDPGWGEAVAEVSTALRPPDDETVGTVAWVEAPLPAVAAGPRLRTLVDAIRASAGPRTVLLACDRSSLDASAQASLLESFGTVIDARAMLPDCPAWFLRTPAGMRSGVLAGSEANKHATVGQLGAIIAHELGNPLSIISSSLQYLRDRLVRTNDDASEFASAALTNVERIQALLHKMLEAGAPTKPVFERTNLNEVVPDLLRLTAPEYERQGITVGASLDGRLPPAWLDPQGLKQVVLNLLKNGLDALGGRGGNVVVRTRLLEPGDGMALDVENDGPPVERDVLPHLFRPFHSTKVGGTGLGLYLSRQIARDHGGDLVVENLPGTGVRFTLLLPIDRRKGGELGPRPDRR